MNKEFIPYEQALALKELGFDEPCFGYYVIENHYSEKKGDFKSVNIIDGYVGYGSYSALSSRTHRMLAPLYQQVFRWFREKHNLDCNVATYALNRPKEYHWLISWTNEAKGHGLSKTYEEAEQACLDKLIEIVNRIVSIKNK